MLEVLVIGTGLIGRKRAAALPPTMKLVQCFDIDSNSANEFAKDFPCIVGDSINESINNMSQGSLAIVAVRHLDLAPIALKCIRAGLHVLIEKPGAISAGLMNKIISEATMNGVIISVGYNHRFHEAAQKLKELSDSKIYGSIQLVRARYGHGGRQGYENEWRAKKKISGGGELLDQGSHLLDLMIFLGGKPILEFSALPTLYWKMDVEDNAFLAGTFSESAKFWVHASWTEWKNLFSFEVFFKTAKVEWSGLNGSYGHEKLTIYHMENGLGVPIEKQIDSQSGDESWAKELIAIEEKINGRPCSSASGEDALAVLKIIDKAYSK